MNIHFIRNATLIIHANEHSILVDPMFADLSTMIPFALFRHKPKRNPTVPLPDNAQQAFQSITTALITHNHPDHIDKKAIDFLTSRNTPTYCSTIDDKKFKNKNLNTYPLTINNHQPFLDGHITPIPTQHGYGGILTKLMGKGVGYFIELPNQPTLYISGDTIITHDVKSALTSLKPDIAIVAAGSAQADLGKPILMTIDDIVEFTRLAPNQVVANHLEAINHCPTTRKQLAAAMDQANLTAKIQIPTDGQTLSF
ncbi:MBL fold metallo-hydrolase [Planctomycetota bacterium]|nr:MBL fold metallo-hydrolase [Planctomycetota bacterium]